MFRRVAAVLAVALGAAVAGLGAGQASAAGPLIGPECAENVRAAVLAAVEGRTSPGQVIQYLQITADGQLQLCTVTVPS